ncbi:MAG: exodeoxyribonuclease V subunit gamma, partial [Proteobacteria bacterium]|nr:exodeoxyribonuclease V subunit gamma [Pseudomonadota bacterium]
MEALADLLAGPVANPMEPEWIAVQSLGMKTWLEMQISKKLGVWANFRLLFPRYLVEQIFNWVLGEKFVKSKHFEVGYLTWSVMELLPKFTHMEEFKPIAHYLANDDFGLKRFQLSSQIAKVFDEYVLYRPDMIVDWEKTEGDDWQGILWNGLAKQHGHGHFAAQAKLFFETLEEQKEPPFPFPKRISLFGIVTLPPLFVKILGSLPDSVNVNLFLVSPSEKYWADIRSKREIIRGLTTDNTPLDELENLFHLEEGNPLLASMGRLGRDFLYLLEDTTHYTERTASLYEDPGDKNMLATLQSDILHLNNRAINQPPTVIAANDASISIHACHSPMREMEVLKDRLLSLFDSDGDLQPHDIIVMAPDIDTYAPYIDAVFGTSPPRIPYRISDRSIRRGAPVIEAFLAVLDMVRGRVTIQEVLDLLGLQAVQQKFALTKDEVEIAAGWTKQVGIRWGMDAAHRSQLDQPEYEENTWQFGLDRLLLGYAMPLDNQRLFGGVLPYDEIEGQEALILGRFTSFINALFRELKALRKIRHPREWKNALTQTLHHMMELNLENSDQHKHILDTLTRLEAVADESGFSEPVALPVVRRFLLDHLDKDQSARGFLRNGITCCSLLPMRSIPFKVVCLIGMNEGAFPRSYKGPGFDKMVGAPRMGDRSVRSDDRYLFLESLNAARQCVLITYNGFSVVDGSVLPPSVLVDELLDTVKGGFVPEETTDNATEDVIRKRLVISHPLHPFNPAYFAVGDDNRLFSYSNSYLKSAKKLHAGKHETVQRFSGPLPIPMEEKRLVTLSELASFYHMPCRYLVKSR